VDLGALLTRNAELAAQARGLMLDPEAPFPILSAKIKLTWRCNLRCSFCRLWRKPPKRKELGDRLEAGLVAEMLEELKLRGLLKVHFSGGEALLRPDLPEVIRSARRLDLQVNLTTNGTLLDKDMARFMVEQRVHSITISIDSPVREHHDALRGKRGAWRAAIRALEHLSSRRERKGRGPILAINTVVTRHNVDELGELYELLREKRADRWLLLPVDTEEQHLRPSEEQWQRLSTQWGAWSDLLRRAPIGGEAEKGPRRAGKGQYAGGFYAEHPCFAPWFNVFIDADGSAYPCCAGKGAMRPYGNVIGTPLRELLDGERRREVCCSMAAGHAFPVCESCDDYLHENAVFAKICEKEEPSWASE
jgi:MoaA/NifB/PqqE/SkfB family radical SAM enzyme